MDGREGMAFPGGSAPYYMQHKGGGVSGSGPGTGTQSGGFQPPSGFRALSNVSPDSAFKVESHSYSQSQSQTQPQPQHASFSHGMNIGSSPDGGGGVPSSGEPMKKKRGRPRKYGPDGSVSLMLSPMSATASSTPASGTSSEKRPRGRPPGSGRKQQLATLGEWMNSSAGLAFTPHVITIGVEEDIVAKLLSFARQRPRAVCILTGTGTISSVTLRQPASTSVGVTYEGRFQILCLSGSYLVAEEGGPHNRTGGMSVSLSSPDGHIIGGGVTRLVASSPVQVVACSFVYGGSKPKTKQVTTTTTKDSSSEPQSSDKLASPGSVPPPNQNYTSSSPAPGIWPASSRPVEMKGAHAHTGIDLTRG